MTVLQEILAWSQERPAWQRDALRRLAIRGALSESDIRALTEICKGGHGLAEPQEVVPLDKQHMPDKTAGPPVALRSIFHHRGVNALAEDQTLNFAPGLTLVYGDNGAGKSGYTRILKNACRARGKEMILGNVVSGIAPPKPVVTIKYEVGGETGTREWAGASDDEMIARVSVFDTHAASVYLTEKTDVKFRPFGLDLFDKLVQACKAVRLQLEADQRALGPDGVVALMPLFPPGTAATKFLAGLSSLTKPEALRALAQLSETEEAQLGLLEKALLDQQANDPERLAQQLMLRHGRVSALARHLSAVEAALSPEAVKAVMDARADGVRKGEEAKRLREATFPADLLAGTGTDPWAVMWEAARRFSEEAAYPGKPFPVTTNASQCVLCQQQLDHPAIHRFQQFQAFAVSKTEAELRQLRESYAQRQKVINDLKLTTEAVEEALKEIGLDHEPIAAEIHAAMAANEQRRAALAACLAGDGVLPLALADVVLTAVKATALAEQLEGRIKTLRAAVNKEAQKKMLAEAQELRARKHLAVHADVILNEIERKKRYAAYGLCLDETKTTAVTAKSTAVTKLAVTQRLKQRFQEELGRLSFRHMEVELKEQGGTDGVFYHKLVLTRAPGYDLPKVVSEGEQRCLSIAAFFAELSTADDPSGIVFDDPVSSLDFRWRESVAQRLVSESRTRQVIVFTHDVVFLLALKRYAEQGGITPLDQHVRQLPKGAGVCEADLPWVAMAIKKKLGFLKNEWQAADKLERDGHQSAYEKEAKNLYGMLREGWERALEEVLLGGLVERFRPSIQTQQIALIADITPDDCKAVEVAMTKCSTWLTGHDQAPAARAPVPQSAELRADIEALENWVSTIRKRRDKSAKAAA
jgi:energy-coupling factor transporter ATP-binding protein EcfA2